MVACQHPGCTEKFRYFKTWQVTRRFCLACAAKRNSLAKRTFEAEVKRGVVRSPDEDEAMHLLRRIPDSMNWNTLLRTMAAGA